MPPFLQHPICRTSSRAYQMPFTEAAKWNPAINNAVIYTWAFPAVSNIQYICNIFPIKRHNVELYIVDFENTNKSSKLYSVNALFSFALKLSQGKIDIHMNV